MKSSKKSVPPKGKSPGVAKDAKSNHKYSTGECGRSCPPNVGKRHVSKTNP